MNNETALALYKTIPTDFEGEIISKSLYPEPFFEQDGCLMIRTTYGERMLCNFIPYIEEELVVTDGTTETRYLKIGSTHKKGYSLKSVTLSINEFKKMNWIEERWGSACNVSAGNSNREQLRFAIQSTAEDILTRKLYSHIGWVQSGGSWDYIMPNSENCFCEDAVVSKYGITESQNQNNAFATLALLHSEVAPREVLYPLVAMMFASPLIEFFNQAGIQMKTVLALIGQTGSKKSTLAALVLSHFGNFTHDSLPLSFRDTANSILERLYALKDVPTVIDDFHPSTRFEETEMTKTAQLLFRAFGDKTARGRMKSNLTIAEPKPPRGSGIITAEFPPSVSESGTARYLSLEILSNDVDMKVLSELQAMAREHEFQKSMFGYIEFLKSNYLTNHYSFVELLKNMVLDYRKQFATSLKGTGYHDRIPEALSYLAVGFYFLCKYFIDSQVETKENCKQLKNDFYETLCAVGRKQSSEIKIDKPHIKFLTKLNSLIASGNLFFAPKGNYEAPRIAIGGYQDDDFYYLIVHSCHKAVKKFCEEQGENFSVTPRQLLQTLDREGFIETANNGERTRTLNVGGSYVRVAFLRKSKLLEIDSTYS